MAYTTIDNPKLYHETLLYTGTGADVNIDGLQFQPDWVWIKRRASGDAHGGMFDSVRGVTKLISSSQADGEQTIASSLKSFRSDGFSLGSGDSGYVNQNSGKTYVAWNWKAGTSFTNDASSTSIGSIDSAGSVNQDAGFSICTFTGTGSIGTIKHGLNTVPKMIIVKGRSEAKAWTVYHSSLGAGKGLFLEQTSAAVDHPRYWNDVEPTTSVFTGGSSTNLTGNGITFVAYCFAEKQGYSKFSSYIGNGQDTPNGVFVHLGFTPAFILIKATDDNSWVIVDNKRPADSNPVDSSLAANSSAAETTGDSNTTFDFLSNGFRTNGNSGNNNSSGQEYIYMAFAENPFVTSTGVPATAR